MNVKSWFKDHIHLHDIEPKSGIALLTSIFGRSNVWSAIPQLDDRMTPDFVLINKGAETPFTLKQLDPGL